MICCLSIPFHLLTPLHPCPHSHLFPIYSLDTLNIKKSQEILLWKPLGLSRGRSTCLDHPFSHWPLSLNLSLANSWSSFREVQASSFPGSLSRFSSSPNPTPRLNQVYFCQTLTAHYAHIILVLSTFYHNNIFIYLSPSCTLGFRKTCPLILSF